MDWNGMGSGIALVLVSGIMLATILLVIRNLSARTRGDVPEGTDAAVRRLERQDAEATILARRK